MVQSKDIRFPEEEEDMMNRRYDVLLCEADNTIGGVHYVKECIDAGYAALDVCGSQPHGLTMGCPEHIFALHKAYLYAIKHYNLSKRVLVAGASMGGHTAMNFAHTFPGIVTALGLIYPRLNLDGVEIDIAQDGVYTVTMDKDHTFTVVFEAPSSVNVGLIIALVIIAVAIVGGAAVFVLRWRKNQF